MTRGEQRAELSAVARALRAEQNHLGARPELTWQQLANRLQHDPSGRALVDRQAGRRVGSDLWWRLRTGFVESQALTRRLDVGPYPSACRISRSGAVLGVAAMDGVVSLWRTGTGRLVRELGGAPAVVDCAFTPDERFLLGVCGNGSAHLWRTDDGEHLREVRAHDGPANACAITPDGTAAVTFGSADGYRRGVVELWRLPGLQARRRVAEVDVPLTFGALSPDGEGVAFGARHSPLLHVASLRRQGRAWSVALDAPGTSCCVTDDGHVVTGDLTGGLVVWTPTGRRASSTRLDRGEVLACATADHLLATASSGEPLVRLWRLPDLEPCGVLQGHGDSVTGCELACSGRTLMTAGQDGSVCVWDTELAGASHRVGHTGLVASCAFSGDGAHLLTASPDGTVRRWETTTGAPLGEPLRHGGDTALLARSSGACVVVAGQDGHVLQVQPAELTDVGRHGAPVWDAALPDNRTAVTAGEDGSCGVWDLAGRGLLRRFEGDGQPVRACVDDSAPGSVLTAGDGGLVHRWHPRREHAVVLTGPGTGLASLAVSADGTVAAGARDGSVWLWEDSAAGSPVGRLPGSVERLLWTGSDRLVAASVDGTLAVWRSGREEEARWRGHRGAVRGLAAGPLPDTVVSAGADRVLVLWTVPQGRQIAVLPVTAQLRDVAVHPRQRVVGLAGDGGLVHLAELV